MNWILDILVTHKRMKGLTAEQLIDLIEKSKDIESLKIIKDHLERKDFKYPHIEGIVPELVQKCIDRAKLILWRQHIEIVRQQFMETIDPFNL